MSSCLRILCVATTCLVAVALSLPVEAQQQSNLVVVLDGSGSMWGRIEGDRMKIVEAKNVTRELLEDVPAGMNLGFVAYGHRRKGDCSDIETIAAPGTEPAAIADAVDRTAAQIHRRLAELRELSRDFLDRMQIAHEKCVECAEHQETSADQCASPYLEHARPG